MENGEAICCFGEAIAFYDYNVSSGPFFSRFEIVIGPGPGPDRYQSSTIRGERVNCCITISYKFLMASHMNLHQYSNNL